MDRVSRPGGSPGRPASPSWGSERAPLCDLAIADRAPPLVRSALAFAALAHGGQRRASDGAPFIRHPCEVAHLLLDASCPAVIVAAGLLHHTIDGPRVTGTELAARFGPDVGALVRAVREDPAVPTYRLRMQELRERVRTAGRDAALLFAADRISRLRELPALLGGAYERLDAAAAGGARARDRLVRTHRLHLEHQRASVGMLREVVPGHPLVAQLARELAGSPVVLRLGMRRPHA